jgi:hypothetical protein
VFAGLALYMLSKGGDIDMGGEKHGSVQPSVHAVTGVMPAPDSAG